MQKKATLGTVLGLVLQHCRKTGEWFLECYDICDFILKIGSWKLLRYGKAW